MTEQKRSYQKEQHLRNRLGPYERQMRELIAEGNETKIRTNFERWIRIYSEVTGEADGIDVLEKRLQEMALASPGVARVIAGDPPPAAEPNQIERVLEGAKVEYQIGKKRVMLSTGMIGDIEEFHQRVRTVGEAIVKIWNRGKKEGMDNLLIREIINWLLGKYSPRTIRKALPDELKDFNKSRETVAVADLHSANDDNNPLEDSEDHRSEAQITTEVSKSLYVNRPEDPEVEQALEERPVKDRMYIERLEKESKYRLEELNKKQEQIQVLNTKVEGYEDALTKFQSASDPKLQTSQPGKIWMYPFDWILEIQYAAAYKQGLEIEHDGSKVTHVTRITGLERR